MRTLIFDIESTNLAANFGYIICISYMWDGEKQVHTVSITDSTTFQKDPTNDKEVVEKFRHVYIQADRVVAHYGSKFDRNFINTRLMFHHLPPLPPTKLYDTWRVAKDCLRLNSNRLGSVSAVLGVKECKTMLSGPIWIKAMAGDRISIAYVKAHCEMDVKVLYKTFKRLQVLTAETENPAFHSCGEKNLRSHGWRVYARKSYQRLFCIKCGGWFKGPALK